MKVTVSTLEDQIFVLDISEDLELENFKAFCEIESGFPATEIMIVFNGKPLVDNKLSMKNHGISDGDVVILQHIPSRGSSHSSFTSPDQGPLAGLDFSGIQVPGSSGLQGSSSSQRQQQSKQMRVDPAHVRDLFLANPDQLALLKQNNPLLADALATGRLEDFANVLGQQMAEKEKRQERRRRMMNADPFDTEAQRLIAEEIRQKNIEANMEAAMEYNPETFGTVVMLYINCKVNGHQVKAFVDSGAQTTIMSAACAERVNIMRLVDTRWSGLAKGVGVQRILGRIHMVQVQIEKDFLTTSFSILKEQPMDMLLGLDMLKRHQCSIDLNKNVLRIGTTGTETPFLAEQDLPDCARLSTGHDEAMQDAEERDIEQAIKESSSQATQRQTSAVSFESDPRVTISPNDKFGEDDVAALVNLGFTREKVIEELRHFNGDRTQATAALFAKSLSFNF